MLICESLQMPVGGLDAILTRRLWMHLLEICSRIFGFEFGSMEQCNVPRDLVLRILDRIVNAVQISPLFLIIVDWNRCFWFTTLSFI